MILTKEPKLYLEFGKYLKVLRGQKHWNRSYLGKLINQDKYFVRDLERGKQKPDEAMLDKFKSFFGQDIVDSFLDGKIKKENKKMNISTKQHFGQMIRAARENARPNKTQREVGIELGWAAGALSHYEAERHIPTEGQLQGFVNVLNIDSDTRKTLEEARLNAFKRRKANLRYKKSKMSPSARKKIGIAVKARWAREKEVAQEAPISNGKHATISLPIKDILAYAKNIRVVDGEVLIDLK